MIKEYDYYITTNRFSQIAEDIDAAIRKYGESLANNQSGNRELREQARLLCEKHIETSGIRKGGDSFINIDAEFFSNGELNESNLNRFIKDIIKAHGYQRILWEYMGTTGMMTEVSKEKMKEDNFSYIDYLPVALKKNERQKQADILTRNFCKLIDESGFDWSKGYDPNYAVEKKGWTAGYDENQVWTYHSGRNSSAKSSEDRTYEIKLIKIEKGFMLYDSARILINPVILWYLTQGRKLYGGKQSSTTKIVAEIRKQLELAGKEKISEIAFDDASTKGSKTEDLISEYKKILGELCSKDLTATDSEKAIEIIENEKNFQQTAYIDKEIAVIQKKIKILETTKPGITPEEIRSALETETAEIALDISDYDDAIEAGLDEEYNVLRKYIEILMDDRKEEFKLACAVLSNQWNKYKSCGKTKSEIIKTIFEYIQEQKDSDFNYEIPLREIVAAKNEVHDMDEILKEAEQFIPEANRKSAREYLLSIPEQKSEAKIKIFSSLKAAVRNYVAIRNSTGMNIKELFDFAIKENGGTLPKASYIPPAIGYVTPGMQAKTDLGSKRIFIERTTSNLFNELIHSDMPVKKVVLAQLEKRYDEKNKDNRNRPVITIRNLNGHKNFVQVYDDGDSLAVNEVVLQILRRIWLYRQDGQNTEEMQPEVQKILAKIAKESNSKEDFIKTLEESFQVQYDIQDETSRSLYETVHTAGTERILKDYAEEFEQQSKTKILATMNETSTIKEIPCSFEQIDISQAGTSGIRIPNGVDIFSGKEKPQSSIETISIMSSRKKAESIAEASLTYEQKKEVTALIENLTSEERIELVHSAGDNYNNLTPLLVKEYMWRKANKRKTDSLFREVSEIEYKASGYEGIAIPFIVSKTFTENSHAPEYADVTRDAEPISSTITEYTRPQDASTVSETLSTVEIPSERDNGHDYVHRAESSELSPVIIEYLKTHGKSSFTTSLSWNDGTASTESPGFANSARQSTVQLDSSVRQAEHVELNEIHPMGESLRNAMENLVDMRIPSSKSDPMATINANYEHDKAILAKTDPMFAKNQFWDVGHADGSGDELDRNLLRNIINDYSQYQLDFIRSVGKI